MKIPEEISVAIRDAESIVLFTHIHPDGDALGSLLGFADVLEGLQKRVFCYLEEEVPYLYHFLPGRDRVNTSLADLDAFIEENGKVTAISLDCGDCDRLGKNAQKLQQIEPFLVIDHHRSHRNFGQYRYVDPSKSSTGEMVYELACQLEGDISYEAAYNLYVAISTDTGSFCYDSTSPRTLRIAADLVELGVQPDEVSGQIYNNYTPERIRLMEMVLGTLHLYDSGRLAMIHVTQQMFAESKALPEDIEGFIDLPRSIRGVRVAAFIKENKNDVVSVSLRAKGTTDVAEIAKSFGGGGHRNAAGFRFSGKTLEEVRTIVTDELVRVIE
jgi:bifunctional oligoribonuclease and PAP phosphatase NrnA